MSRKCISHIGQSFEQIRDFKLHLEIAFSNFDPSWDQTHLLTDFPVFDVIFILTGYLSVYYNCLSDIDIYRTFLFFFFFFFCSVYYNCLSCGESFYLHLNLYLV